MTIMCAVLLTERGVKHEGLAAEANHRVMLLEPGHAENYVMGHGSYLKPYRFFVASGAKDKRIIVCDVSRLGLTSVGKDKGDRVVFRVLREAVVVRKLVINEATLTSAVYHGPSRYPIHSFCWLEIHINMSYQ